MASPRPAPPYARVSELSACSEVLEDRLLVLLARCRCRCPSRRWRPRGRSRRAAADHLTEPSGVNLSALVSRLSTICFTFCRSVRDRRQLRRQLRCHRQPACRRSAAPPRPSPRRSAPAARTRSRCSGILPASMRVMSRMSLMIDEQVPGVGVDARAACASAAASSRRRRPASSMLRVAEDGVQRRAELVRHVGEELRLQRRGLLQLDVPAAAAARSARRARRWPRGPSPPARSECALELLVEPRLLQRLGAVVEDGDDRGDLAVLGEHLAGDRLDGQRRAGLRDRSGASSPRQRRAWPAKRGWRRRRRSARRWCARAARASTLRLPAATVNRRSAGAFISTMLARRRRSRGWGRRPSR